MKDKKIGFLWGLLVFETVILVAVLALWDQGAPKPDSKTNFEVLPGQNYSLLLDSERFPIAAAPGSLIQVKVVPGDPQPPVRLPEGRTRIPFSEDQKGGAEISRPRFQFYFDSPEVLKSLRARENLESLRGETAAETLRNVMAWTRDQFPPGNPKVYPTQNALELLDILRSGKEEGFCAQYCYVSAQSLQALGLPARYVSIDNHEVIEAWNPDLKKWVCLDPLNNATFVDRDGTPLSALEINRKGDEVRVVSVFKDLDGKALVQKFHLLEYWISSDLFTRPINVYDLNKHKVRAVFTESDLASVLPGNLFTPYPQELYFPPDRQ